MEELVLYIYLGGYAINVDSASFMRGDNGRVNRRLHNHDLPHTGTEDLIVVRAVKIERTHFYPYEFIATDVVPRTLGDMVVSEIFPRVPKLCVSFQVQRIRYLRLPTTVKMPTRVISGRPGRPQLERPGIPIRATPGRKVWVSSVCSMRWGKEKRPFT